MQLVKTTVFNFSHAIDGTTFNFSIPAPTEAEAVAKLAKSLRLIVSELDSFQATKAN
jgi:hypothetical protein